MVTNPNTFPNLSTTQNITVFLIGIQIVVLITTFWFMRSADKTRRKALSAEEKAERLANWEPEPLCETVDQNHPALRPRLISGRVGKRITVDGQDCLNLASLNFLGLLDERNGETEAVQCINKYGVGSCGPRGFYGTNGWWHLVFVFYIFDPFL